MSTLFDCPLHLTNWAKRLEQDGDPRRRALAPLAHAVAHVWLSDLTPPSGLSGTSSPSDEKITEALALCGGEDTAVLRVLLADARKTLNALTKAVASIEAPEPHTVREAVRILQEGGVDCWGGAAVYLRNNNKPIITSKSILWEDHRVCDRGVMSWPDAARWYLDYRAGKIGGGS